MKVVFRADASIEIGTGHIMRCLTLAATLKSRGAECTFICRSHDGDLNDLINRLGYRVVTLPRATGRAAGEESELFHADWLGVTQVQDSQECQPHVAALRPDWIVVDHYSLDYRWEEQLKQFRAKTFVIDDLADRTHTCELLLDQNLGRHPKDYKALVSGSCRVLAGAEHALLRSEFASLRKYSLDRRKEGSLKRLLINLGGVDKPNATGQILSALEKCMLPSDLEVLVVLGPTCPWISEVREQASRVHFNVKVTVGVESMARTMAESDIAVGAAGSTSWERCCLGLPTIVVCIAENQNKVTVELEKHGAAIAIQLESLASDSGRSLAASLDQMKKNLSKYSESASRVTDGLGADRVASMIAALS